MSDYDSALKLGPAIPEIRDPPLGNYNRRSRVRNRKSHSPDWESVVLNPRLSIGNAGTESGNSILLKKVDCDWAYPIRDRMLGT